MKRLLKESFLLFVHGNKCHLSCFAMTSSLYGPGKKNEIIQIGNPVWLPA